MKKELHLQPICEYLSRDIAPEELARFFDELAFDYMRLAICLQQMDESNLFIHPEADLIIHHLKMMRDALRKCRV